MFHKHDFPPYLRYSLKISEALPFHAIFCGNSNAETKTFNAKIRPIFFLLSTSSVPISWQLTRNASQILFRFRFCVISETNNTVFSPCGWTLGSHGLLVTEPSTAIIMTIKLLITVQIQREADVAVLARAQWQFICNGNSDISVYIYTYSEIKMYSLFLSLTNLLHSVGPKCRLDLPPFRFTACTATTNISTWTHKDFFL